MATGASNNYRNSLENLIMGTKPHEFEKKHLSTLKKNLSLYDAAYAVFYMYAREKNDASVPITRYLNIAKIVHTKDVASLPSNQKGLFNTIFNANYNSFVNEVENKLVSRFDEFLEARVDDNIATPLEKELHRHSAHIEAFLKATGSDMKDWDGLKLALVQEYNVTAKQLWNNILSLARSKTPSFKTTETLKDYLLERKPYQTLVPAEGRLLRLLSKIPDIKNKAKNWSPVRKQALAEYPALQNKVQDIEFAVVTENYPVLERLVKEVTTQLGEEKIGKFIFESPTAFALNTNPIPLIAKGKPFDQFRLDAIPIGDKVYLASTNPFKNTVHTSYSDYFDALEAHNVTVIVDLAESFEPGNLSFLDSLSTLENTSTIVLNPLSRKPTKITLLNREHRYEDTIHDITISEIEVERKGVKKEYKLLQFHCWEPGTLPAKTALDFLSKHVADAEKGTPGRIAVYDNNDMVRSADFITYHHSATHPEIAPESVLNQYMHASENTPSVPRLNQILLHQDPPPKSYKGAVEKQLDEYEKANSIFPRNENLRAKLDHFLEDLSPYDKERVLYHLTLPPSNSTQDKAMRDKFIAYMLESGIKYVDLTSKIAKINPYTVPSEKVIFSILNSNHDPKFSSVGNELSFRALYPEVDEYNINQKPLEDLLKEKGLENTPENRLTFLLEQESNDVTKDLINNNIKKLLSDKSKFNDVDWLNSLSDKIWNRPEISQEILPNIPMEAIPNLRPSIFSAIRALPFNPAQFQEMTVPQWNQALQNNVIENLSSKTLFTIPNEVVVSEHFFDKWDLKSVPQFIRSKKPPFSDAEKLAILKNFKETPQNTYEIKRIKRALIGSLRSVQIHERAMNELYVQADQNPQEIHNYFGKALEKYVQGVNEYIAETLNNEKIEPFYPDYFASNSNDYPTRESISSIEENYAFRTLSTLQTMLSSEKTTNTVPTDDEKMMIVNLYKEIMTQDEKYTTRMDIAFVLRLINHYSEKYKISLDK